MHKRKVNLAFIVVLVWTILVSLARAVRWPNNLAEAHWVINYTVGLYKRAITGTIFLPVFKYSGLEPLIVVRLLTALVLGLMMALVFYVCLRIFRKLHHDAATKIFLLAFSCSPFVIMAAHLIGYLDTLVYLLSIIALLLLFRGRRWAGYFTISFAILVHESATLMTLPLFLLADYARVNRDAHGISLFRAMRNFIKKSWMHLTLPALAMLFVAYVVMSVSNMDEHNARLTEYFKHYTFLNPYIPQYFTGKFTKSVWKNLPEIWNRVANPLILIAMLPLMVFSILILRQFRYMKEPPAFRILLIIALFLPQLIHAIAWDTMRIWCYSHALALMIVWVASEVLINEGNAKTFNIMATGWWFVLGCILIFCLHSFMNLPLMDGEPDRFNLKQRLVLYSPMFILVFYIFRKNRNSDSIEETDHNSLD